MTEKFKSCLGCAKPSCASACPINNDIPQFLQYVNGGDYASAVQILGHPFGEICGYVCPHERQCQGGCVLNKRGAPVLISEAEILAFSVSPYKLERFGNLLSGMSVAVVGGGVCGITFAVKMYEQGADVTVYEKDKLLSTLRLIPSFRLPIKAVERVERAVNGKINVVNKLVNAVTMQKLRRNYDVVLVASGASLNYGLGVIGEELATDYKDCLLGKYSGNNVVIIGGGNSAMDCARYVVSRGGNATVAYRRTVQDMPAFSKEIEQAQRENVKFCCNAAPVKLEKSNGKLLLTLAKTVSEGRGKLVITDETTAIECDCVVSAVGSKFDGELLGGTDNSEQYDNVYIGGDAAGGKLVAEAVADGIRLAQTIIDGKR